MLEVIGAGFGRTGTYSLKLALEELGLGPCHHMFELRQDRQQLERWQAAANDRDVDWNNVFSNYRSQVDWPGAYFWKQIWKAFPQAKVILTYREPQAWYRSFRETIVAANTAGRVHDPDPHTRAMANLVDDIVFRKTFGGRPESESHAISVYLAHCAEVMRKVPSKDLLFFEISQGWLPLCEFLGVGVPEKPFPLTNSKAEFLSRKKFLEQVNSRC